jgi:predicted RNA binding protein YcfA (HicA-like mRNA interferase family)
MLYEELAKLLQNSGWKLENDKVGYLHFVHPLRTDKITMTLKAIKHLMPGTLKSILVHGGL